MSSIQLCIKGIGKKFNYVLEGFEGYSEDGCLVLYSDKNIHFILGDYYDFSHSINSNPIVFEYRGHSHSLKGISLLRRSLVTYKFKKL